MKGFKKLVLASAILAASSTSFAMQAMDDASLSAATGQDGLTVFISNANMVDTDITYVDRDGFQDGVRDGAGALVINNLDVTLTNLQLDIDVGDSGAVGGDAQLKIGFSTADDIIVGLGNTTIDVATAGAGSAVSNNEAIIGFDPTASLTVTGGISGEIRLGHQAAGTEHLMTLSTGSFNVSLTGLKIGKVASDIGIGVGTVNLTNVVLNNAIDVVPAGTAFAGAPSGLLINTTGTSIGEVGLETVKLGDMSAAGQSIGDVYLNNLNVASTILIAAH